MIDFVANYTKKAQRSSETATLAAKYANYTYILARFMFVSFYGAGALALLYPMYSIFVLNELLLPFGFVIPGVNYTTHPGFEINYVHHIVQVVFVCTGLGAAFMFFIIIVLNVCLQMDIICVKLNLLANHIYGADNGNLQDVDFTEIIKLHQQALKYIIYVPNNACIHYHSSLFSIISQLEDIFCVQYLIDAVSIEFQVILCLYVALTDFWIPGPYIMLEVLGFLFIDCLYGYVILQYFTAEFCPILVSLCFTV